MKIFLKLKHWQLFGTLVVIPLIFQIILMDTVVPENENIMFVTYFPFLWISYIVILFGWLYTLGASLHKKLPTSVNINLTLFKVFIIIPVAYMLFLSIFIYEIVVKIYLIPILNPNILAIIIPLHLFSMFCIIYCLYFIAKALKSIEWQKPVTFSDFAGEFFLIWFFPIGIWFIQPRINKLFDTSIEITELLENNNINSR